MFPRNGGGVAPVEAPDAAPEVVPEPALAVVPEPTPEVVPLPAVPEEAPEVVVPEPTPEAVVPEPTPEEGSPEVVPEPTAPDVDPEVGRLPVVAPEVLPVVAEEPEDDPDVFCGGGVAGVLEQAPPKLAAARATNPDVASPTTRAVFDNCKLMDIGNLLELSGSGGHSRSRRRPWAAQKAYLSVNADE